MVEPVGLGRAAKLTLGWPGPCSFQKAERNLPGLALGKVHLLQLRIPRLPLGHRQARTGSST